MTTKHRHSGGPSVPSEDPTAVGGERVTERVGRRQLVTTGLVAPVILTLGTRAALAQPGGNSSGGSHMASVKKK